MRRFRPSWLLVSLSFVLLAVGCKTGSSNKSDESLTEDGRRVPGFFKEIPADTLYVYTGLEPFPADTAESLLEQANESGSFTPAGVLKKVASGMPDAPPVLEAIAAELEGKVNPEGLEELGFKLDAHSALYGLGGIPVVRLELGDPQAFEAMLNRIETESDTDVEMKESDGISYRLYRVDGGTQAFADQDGSIEKKELDDTVFPLVIRDDAVYLSMMEESSSDVVLPYLLGQNTPDESLADVDAVREVAEAYGYEKFGVGYVDLERALGIVSGVADPSPLQQQIFDAEEIEPEEFSDVCNKEISELIATMPRVVFGIQEFSTSTVQFHGGLEIDSEYTDQMADAVEPIPAKGSGLFQHAALSLGFGVDVKKMLGVFRARAKAIAEDPYQCEEFDEFNEQAKRFQDRPLPPAVEQLRGATLILEGLGFRQGAFMPNNVEAITIVRTENPQALLGRLQAVVPGLMQADVKDDGVPVALPQLDQMFNFLNAPHIAMKEDAVAFSTGVGMQDEMGALLENAAPEASMAALAFSYNLDKIESSLPSRAKDLLTELLGDAYAASMTGSSSVEVQMTGRGVFFESRSRTGKSESQGGKQADAEQSTDE